MRHTLNAICPYYTMFPLTFPLRYLESFKIKGMVLDPFCGRGTTNFAARILGLPSVGYDTNPVAVAITQAKLVQVSPNRIINLARRILKDTEPDSTPEGEFWNYAYHPDTLQDLLKLRHGLRIRKGQVAAALRGIILGALHGPQAKTKDSYFSNQMPRTFAPKPNYSVRWWKAKGIKARRVDVLELIAERSHRYYGQELPKVSSRIRLRDSRKLNLKNVRVSATITSPPYVGMNTYVSDQWLRNWFLGGPPFPHNDRENQLGVSNTEAFIADLAKVWRLVARVSHVGAPLVIRFGAIGSRKTNPRQVVIESINRSCAPWRIERIESAGTAKKGKRQADQMGTKVRASGAIEEVDVICYLEEEYV